MSFFVEDNDWNADERTESLNKELFDNESKQISFHKNKRRKKRKSKFEDNSIISNKTLTDHQEIPSNPVDISIKGYKGKKKGHICAVNEHPEAYNSVEKTKHEKNKKARIRKNWKSQNNLPIKTINDVVRKSVGNINKYKECNNEELFIKAKKRKKTHTLKNDDERNKMTKQVKRKRTTMSDSASYQIKDTDLNMPSKKPKYHLTKNEKINNKIQKPEDDIDRFEDSLTSNSKLPNMFYSTSNVKKLKNIFQHTEKSLNTVKVDTTKQPLEKIKLDNIKKEEKMSGVFSMKKEKRELLSSALKEKASGRLQAARFRYINEKMYTSSGKESENLFKLDPTAFEVYHDGFNQQVAKWPLNPVDVIICDIQKKPKSFVIADFGCGDAKIAQSFPARRIHSFDLVSLCNLVTECDMANVPLTNGSIDIAIFCLALMGTNLNDYICEAHRVLKMGGILKMAEIISRFEDVDTFIYYMKKFGFSLLHQKSYKEDEA